MAKKSFWQILWTIAKPILTVGISLLVPVITKSLGSSSSVVDPLIEQTGTSIINAADSAINGSSNSTDANKESAGIVNANTPPSN